MSRRRLIAIVLAVAPAAAAAQTSIPLPDLTRVDPAVRTQIEAVQGRFMSLETQRPGSVEAREALRFLGELYLAYGLRDAAGVAFESLDGLHDDARALYLLGYVHENRGEVEQAVSLFSEVVELDAGNAPAHLRRGKLLLEGARRLAEADGSFVDALAADPACAAALYGRGEVVRLRGDWPMAVDHYQSALALAPDSDQIRYALGIALRQSGRLDEARVQLQRTTARVTVASTTWEGCADPVLAEVGRLATGVSAHLLRGALAFFDGDIEGEVAEYAKAVQQAENDAEAHMRYGSALLRSGRVTEAVAEYEKAQRLDPSDAVPFFDLAEIRRSQGRLTDAEALYRGALERDAGLDQALVHLGSIAIGRGEPAVGESLFRQALEVDPRAAGARAQLAVILLRSERREEGVAELQRALEETPPADPDELSQLAVLLLLMGDVEGGLSQLRTVVDSDASAAARAGAHYWIGTVYLGRDEIEPAISSLEAALALDPELADAQVRLDEARRKQGPDGGF